MSLAKLIRHEQGHVVTEHELHNTAQRGALGEVDEVLEGKGEVHVLVHLDADPVGQFVVVV